jgi:diguanylate cyclase (GGDEF)-like protein
VRASDTVARLGGDEFTVILENLSSPETAQAVVDKVMGVLRHPYVTAEEEIQTRASIGIAYFNGGELKPDGLIKQADAALYQAKHRGRNGFWVHQPAAA